MRTLVIVSGGDAPGINLALAHFAQFAHTSGDDVLGAMGSFAGVLEGSITPLNHQTLELLATRSGSFLTSNRAPALAAPDAQARLTAVLASHNIDNLLLFGGNGTLRHILPLMESWGIQCIAIPSTIDNDVPRTDETLGFDSACNFACHSLDSLLATAHAMPGRLFTLETLGGDTGFLALAVAHAARAHAALLPEFPFELAWLADRAKSAVQRDGFALVVHSEGIPDSRALPERLSQATGIRVRDVRLGHAQRGAPPSHRDRVLAVQMAQSAYNALKDGIPVGAVLVRHGDVIPHLGTLEDAPARSPDRSLHAHINGLSVYTQNIHP